MGFFDRFKKQKGGAFHEGDNKDFVDDVANGYQVEIHRVVEGEESVDTKLYTQPACLGMLANVYSTFKGTPAVFGESEKHDMHVIDGIDGNDRIMYKFVGKDTVPITWDDVKAYHKAKQEEIIPEPVEAAEDTVDCENQAEM